MHVLSFFLFLSLLLSSCSRPLSNEQIIEKFASRAYQQEGLELEGYRIKNDEIWVLFMSHKHVGIDEARRMMSALYYQIEKYLKTIEVLHEENLILGIQFKENDLFVDQDYVAEVTEKKGIMRFYIWSNNKRVLVHQEKTENAFGKSFGYEAEQGFAPFTKISKIGQF